MSLTLILGPMKSGKSFDLISRFSHLKYTKIPFALFNSKLNVRDENVSSRTGAYLEGKKIKSLREIPLKKYKIVGIEEIHMFAPADAGHVEKLLKAGVEVIVCGLDLGHQGTMFEIVKKMMELGPKEVVYRRAVCDKCRSPQAVYTQVLIRNKPLLGGLPAVMPDDGTYGYKAVCRKCFKKIKIKK